MIHLVGDYFPPAVPQSCVSIKFQDVHVDLNFLAVKIHIENVFKKENVFYFMLCIDCSSVHPMLIVSHR